MSNFATTLAEELRAAMLDLEVLHPNPKRPDQFSERKSEVLFKIEQVTLMLEGNFNIIKPPTPKPASPTKKRPTVIEDAKGNVVKVDFKARHAVKRSPDS